jgi:hypothetical protein
VLVYAALILAAACQDALSPPAATRTLRPAAPVTAASTKDIPPNGMRLGYLGETDPVPRTRYRMEYHNGRVMRGVADVYLIWYGDWASRQRDKLVLTDFASSIGNTPYMGIARYYADSSGAPATAATVYAGSVDDAYSHGATLADSDIVGIVETKMMNSELPQDPAGIYVVLASPDVSAPGQGSTYCAKHSANMAAGGMALIIYIGGPSRFPFRCMPQPIGPNATSDGDAAVSLLAAELLNTLTDPLLNAWYDRLGLEAADKCAWTWGTTYRAANGAAANVHLGQRDYLLQQLWVPSKNGGACALHW